MLICNNQTIRIAFLVKNNNNNNNNKIDIHKVETNNLYWKKLDSAFTPRTTKFMGT